MYSPIREYHVLECHVLRYTSVNFNTFARLKIDQTLVFKLPMGSSARGYEWNFCYSPTTYYHFSDGWHPYYYASHRLIIEKSENCQFLLSCWRYLNFVFAEMFIG